MKNKTYAQIVLRPEHFPEEVEILVLEASGETPRHCKSESWERLQQQLNIGDAELPEVLNKLKGAEPVKLRSQVIEIDLPE